jgi:hypothetical protein
VVIATDMTADTATSSATRHRIRQRERRVEVLPSSERQEVYKRRVYALTCPACDLDGEIQGAAAAGVALRLHAQRCRGGAYGTPTGRIGTP